MRGQMLDHPVHGGGLGEPAAVAIAAAVVDDFVIAHAAILRNLAPEDAVCLLLPVKRDNVGEELAHPAVAALVPVQRDIRAGRIAAAAELRAVADLILRGAASTEAFAAARAKVRKCNRQASDANWARIRCDHFFFFFCASVPDEVNLFHLSFVSWKKK
jgi:hypothetical protein